MSSHDNRKKPPPVSNEKANLKPTPPPARTAAPSLMASGAASMPGAFPRSGMQSSSDIEMSAMAQKMSAINIIKSRNGGNTVASLPVPGAVSMPGIVGSSGSPSNGSKDVKSDGSSRTESTRESGMEHSVNDDGVAMVAVLPPPEEVSEDEYKRRKMLTMGAAVGGLLIVAIIIIVVVVVAVGGGSEEEQSVVAAADSADELEDPRLVVSSFSNATVDAILNDISSSEHVAYEWVKRDPNLETYPQWRREQRYAMALLYYAISGSRTLGYQTRLRDWLSYQIPECEWGGSYFRDEPYCNEEGQITWLTFQGFQRFDPIPTDIIYLSHLEILDFRQENAMNKELAVMLGRLPPNLTESFPSLHTLAFADAQLKGTVPGELLSTLTNLRKLDLSGNNFQKLIPSELGLLHKLEKLNLRNNGFTGTLPEEMGNMASLAELTMDDNPKLEQSLPSGFCNEDTLTTLVTDWCSSVQQCCSN